MHLEWILKKSGQYTLGMNFRGGMDEREFRLYFLNSIVPFFPDAQDVNILQAE